MCDFVELQILLESWNLGDIFTHLRDEEIDIDELQMMRPHHVAALLANYKLGTRIRFEHHLDVWRHSLNKPLLQSAVPTPPYAACAAEHSFAQPNSLSPNVKGRAASLPRTATRATNTDSVVAKSVATNTVIPAALPPPPLAPPPPSHELFGELSTWPTQDELILPPDLVPSIEPKQKPVHGPHVPLAYILQTAGAKGASIRRYYRKHNTLTNSHRALLIHLIVSYFESNEFHLSLNVSHNLEREVLRMFPTESLSDYRTEKRGKIYVKFCNMKRYKRSVKRKGGSGGSGGGGSDASIPPGSGDSGPQVAVEIDEQYEPYDWTDHQSMEMESPPLLVEIKTEKTSEDAY